MTDFNANIYIPLLDKKGYPWVKKEPLSARVLETADIISTPLGINCRTQIQQKDGKHRVIRWDDKGTCDVIGEYDTDEEATQAWLETIYKNDFQDSEEVFTTFYTKDEAIVTLSGCLGLKPDVVESMVHHHELYADIEAQRTARDLMEEYNLHVGRNNNKKLQELYQKIDRNAFYMYGSNHYTENETRLDVQKYIPKALIKEARTRAMVLN